MKLNFGKAIVALAFSIPLLAQAAIIRSDFRLVSGSAWTVDFTVVDDGTPASIAGFTIYFPEATYRNLTLTASPSTWDSLVIQPDPALPDAGFLDSIVLNPANALTPGQSLAGFRVGFNFNVIAGVFPGSLTFEIYNPANFNVLFSGRTLASVVPEPSSLLLAGLGLSGLAGFRTRRRRSQQNSVAGR